MKVIKTLIVDDAILYRAQIRSALESIKGIEVVGVAANGKIAIDKMSQHQIDLLILDLEMPEVDGLQTLKEMKRIGYKCKILVFSSFSKRGAEITIDALSMGASDFVPKPSGDQSFTPESEGANFTPTQKIFSLLEPKIKALFPDHFAVDQSATTGLAIKPARSILNWDLFRPKIIVIGASTGGPVALEKIFMLLQAPLNCPIVITQHMPPIFTTSFAQRLTRAGPIECHEISNGMVLQKNTAYMAPGGYHTRLEAASGEVKCVIDQGPLINSVRPAVDPLFTTAAAIYKKNCLGIVLTGMGADGRVGAEDVKAAGGAIIIQSESSCVVFGMPGAVKSANAYDFETTPEKIAEMINNKVSHSIL
jgi:two-component system, chemotaxis family, protein-glutamate methylesterase/glutaminase